MRTVIPKVQAPHVLKLMNSWHPSAKYGMIGLCHFRVTQEQIPHRNQRFTKGSILFTRSTVFLRLHWKPRQIQLQAILDVFRYRVTVSATEPV